MTDYKELYTMYEEREDLHPETMDTATVETAINELLHCLDADLMFELDALLGRMARAYEMQGFLFGLNYARVHR